MRICAYEGGCKAPPLKDSDLCVFHDPRYIERCKEARRAGGLNTRAKSKAPTTVAEAAAMCAEVASQMRRGRMSERRGSAIIRALRAYKALVEQDQIIGKIQELERRANGVNK